MLHKPMHYRAPERDPTSEGMFDLAYEFQDLGRDYTYSDGIFELDENHRMVTFGGPPDDSLRANMNIVNMDTETSVSTRKDLGLLMAKNGFLYTLGGYEQFPSGRMGNETIEVWEFQPFEPSHAEVRK